MEKLMEQSHLNNNDHVFSKWLRDHNWLGRIEKNFETNTSSYLTEDGKIICKVLYANWGYRVFA